MVYITTAQLMRDVWSRNVFSVPRGTGSGFIWDDAGHVVTNFHEGSVQSSIVEGDVYVLGEACDGSIRQEKTPTENGWGFIIGGGGGN